MAITLRTAVADDSPVPDREMMVRHLRDCADGLVDHPEYAVLVAPFAIRFLGGEGEIEPFWPELPFALQVAMVAAAGTMDAGGDCTPALALMRQAADVIEEGGR